MNNVISDKWQDKEYREKQLKARQELGKDPKFKGKMLNYGKRYLETSNLDTILF